MTKKRKKPTAKERRDLFEEAQRQTLDELSAKHDKPKVRPPDEDDVPSLSIRPRITV